MATDSRRIVRALRLMLNSSLDAVLPRTCRVCGCSLTVGEELLCLDCMSNMPRTGLHRVAFNDLHQRIGRQVEVDVAAGWFYYYRDSQYARLICEAKYDSRPATAFTLGRMYAEELQAEGYTAVHPIDVLLPVPLHYIKHFRRGYNQSEEIARGMASVFGCDVGDNLVARHGHRTQTHRGSYGRYINVKGTYGLKNGSELEGLRVAVVDDVITTGSTILDCLKAIDTGAKPASCSVLTIGVAKMR